MLALGIIGLVGTVVLWLISKRHNQEVNSGDNGNKKLFYTEMILLIAATLFFGGRIVYSAVPYHGALSWKLDEWMRKKEVELEHNNLFEDGVEGILMDLDEALQLPEELYIANKYQVSFDENGTIQPLNLSVGDKILFGSYAGVEVKNGEFTDGEYLILTEDEILGIIG